MEKNKNLPEFLALMERYKTITLEEIKSVYSEISPILPDRFDITRMKLTGFGSISTCTLCKEIISYHGASCKGCVYATSNDTNTYCIRGKMKETYNRIRYADTPKKLLNAYRKRAEFMQLILDIKEIPKP